MSNFEEKEYKVFEMFKKQWGLVTAGDKEHFNSCTIGWGSLGTLWARQNGGSVVTVFLHPGRYTTDVMFNSEYFTVSFFPQEYRKALGVMGTVSGRDHDKVKESGLTPVQIGESITYEEAELTFYCRKIYQHKMAKEDIAPEYQEMYASNPKVYPVDEDGQWQPHWVFIGEVVDTLEKQAAKNDSKSL